MSVKIKGWILLIDYDPRPWSVCWVWVIASFYFIYHLTEFLHCFCRMHMPSSGATFAICHHFSKNLSQNKYEGGGAFSSVLQPYHQRAANINVLAANISNDFYYVLTNEIKSQKSEFYIFHVFSWSWLDRINWCFCSESFHLSCIHTLLVGNSFWQRSAQLRLNWAKGRKEEGGEREHNLETMWTHFSIFCTHWSLSCPPAGRRTAGGPLTHKNICLFPRLPG